jgi:F-type H+-transporting ATPase subunit epsilon
MIMLLQVDIVSAEIQIYSGKAEMVIVTGILGEIGIVYGHSPLLTKLKPGYVRIKKENKPDSEEEYIYVSGGILEIQPHTVSILAETAVRGTELDEAAALASKERAEQLLKSKQHSDFDYSLAESELAQAMAQLKTIKDLRKKLRV